MDVIVIAVIWIILFIIGAVIKSASKNKNTSQKSQADEIDTADQKSINRKKQTQNSRRPKVANHRDKDKKALGNLKNILEQQQTTTTKESYDIVEELDQSVQAYTVDKSSSYADDVSTELKPVFESFTAGINDVASNKIEVYQSNIKSPRSSNSYHSSNMFEQAIIYEAILNRKGRRLGGNSRFAKK